MDKKKWPPQYNVFFFEYSINMSNIQKEIEQIKKEIDLLQDRLKKNKKSHMHIGRIPVKTGQRTDLSETKKNTKYSEEYISK